MRKSTLLTLLVGSTLLASTAVGTTGEVLNDLNKRGVLRCGVSTGKIGFSKPDNAGKWTGFDVDFCKAFAVALFNNPNKVEYVPTTGANRFVALQNREIDLLSRSATWTLSRDGGLGLAWGPTTFYDGQGFMVSKKLGVKSAKELNGASMCISQGTTGELGASDYFRANGWKYEPIVSDAKDDLFNSFLAGRCDVITDDKSTLASMAINSAPNPDDFDILPETISKEPLGPSVRQGDPEWFNIMRWTVFAVIQAEELGITSKNIDTFKTSTKPEVKRLLGLQEGVGKNLGLRESWAYDVIKTMGNYGEIYDRHFTSTLHLKRDKLNQLWTNGGMLYSPPFN
jgi:general L-amino acid transport system substrate-binding protein